MAWRRSRQAPSQPSPAPPAAATEQGSREGSGILAGARRQRAAGGSGKGCEYEPEGEGLAAVKEGRAGGWGWLGAGSGGGAFPCSVRSEVQSLCWEVGDVSSRGLSPLAGKGQSPGHLPEDTYCSESCPLLGLFFFCPELAVPSSLEEFFAPRCFSPGE